MRLPDSCGHKYSNPRFPPPNVRLPFQHPTDHNINQPPVSASCFPPSVQYSHNTIPNCVSPMTPSSLPCPNPMSFPPPPFRSQEPRAPPSQPVPVYSEASPLYNQLFNVPPPHSSPCPETPSQVFVPPYPPPPVPATSFTERLTFPYCVDPVGTERCNSFHPPSDSWHNNVQPLLPSIPQNVLNHQERNSEAVITCGGSNLKAADFVDILPYSRDEYPRSLPQGMRTQISDENTYSKYKDRDRRSDDRSVSRSSFDYRRNSSHPEYEAQQWGHFRRQRSQSPLHGISPQRRRSRSPKTVRKRSRDSSRSSDQRPHTRDYKWSRACSSRERANKGSLSPERNRRGGENKKCAEIGDNGVSVKTELESSPRNPRYSNSPGADSLRSHSRASFRRTSHSPDYKSAASSRKRSRSHSPESIKSLSSRSALHVPHRSLYTSSYKEKRAATERELLLEKWRLVTC